MYAELLTIGDELCRGEIVNTNSSWLAAQLWDLDITVRWMTSCRDDVDDMNRAFMDAVGRADVVVCSGGLGPTEDDLTVDVVSALAGREVVIDEPARLGMEARFASRRPPIALEPIQYRQVRVPQGSRVFANSGGLAPGFEQPISGVPVLCVPGVPREMHAIWGPGGMADRLRDLRDAAGNPQRIARRIYRVFGRGESQISVACRGVVDDFIGASIHYQVKFPETLVKIVVRDADADAARERLEAIDAILRERLGHFLYGTDEPPLPECVSADLAAAGLTVATAESCTGGMVGEMLTRAPGSSRYFRGAAVAYANEEKIRQLGVDENILATDGAVSEACVAAMAVGALQQFAVDLTVAVSGVAGPDGGTPEKPVGTVWLATARRGRDGEPIVVTKLIGWPGARDMVRTLAAWWALTMLRSAAAEARRGNQ